MKKVNRIIDGLQNMKSLRWIFVIVISLTPLKKAANAQGYSTQRYEVAKLAKLTTAPATQDADGFESTANRKAIFYDALNWKGKPTKVFAWLGLPANRKGKVPGIVLVHGGGGTAFKEWVQKWNDHGFAAISIAVEGQTDVRDNSKAWKQHDWPGPKRVGIYGDSAEPLKDQWIYHAVADTVLANSLLRSIPEVDGNKVGLMGISWGGVITSTVVGIDDRLAFAIPTYGCGHLFDAQNQYGRSLGKNESYKQVWDPMQRLGNAKLPMLWFSWPQDSHFPLDCLSASYRATKGPQMLSLVPGMGHGHGPPWNRPEGYAFAKAIVQSGKPWCQQTKSAVARGSCHVSFSSEKPFDKAVLVSTTDVGVTGQRKWVESAAELQRQGKQWGATATLPPRTTAWFVNLISGELVVSSAFQEISD